MRDANPDQREAWTSGHGLDWLAHEAELDATLSSIDALLLREAQPKGAMQVMDLGCGTGHTTRRIAAQLQGGAVLGVDISPSLLAEAQQVGGAGVSFLEADAQTHDFGVAQFDLILSRFGSMFFADPVEGLGNLRRSLRPGGRLVMACWRRAKENPWFSVPLRAALTHIGPMGAVDPLAPGPTAFGDPDRVLGLLEQAGFRSARCDVVEPELHYPGSLEGLVAMICKIGPMARLAREHTPDPRALADAAAMVAAHFADAAGPEGVVVPSRLNLFVAEA